jgi:hypothetical protein
VSVRTLAGGRRAIHWRPPLNGSNVIYKVEKRSSLSSRFDVDAVAQSLWIAAGEVDAGEEGQTWADLTMKADKGVGDYAEIAAIYRAEAQAAIDHIVYGRPKT